MNFQCAAKSTNPLPQEAPLACAVLPSSMGRCCPCHKHSLQSNMPSPRGPRHLATSDCVDSVDSIDEDDTATLAAHTTQTRTQANEERTKKTTTPREMQSPRCGCSISSSSYLYPSSDVVAPPLKQRPPKERNALELHTSLASDLDNFRVSSLSVA